MKQPPNSPEGEFNELIERSDNVIRLVSTGGSSLADTGYSQAGRVDAEEAQEESETAADLVRRIRAGDRSAESELVQRYQPRLRHVLLRRMPQQLDEVEDVLQTTFATVIVRLRDIGIEEPSRLAGFLYGVARNMMRASRRDRTRFNAEAGSEVLDFLADAAPGPGETQSVNETTQIVRQLLAELRNTRGREKYAEVLVRYYIEQQTHDEICKALDLKPKDFRNALHRAKRRLRELVTEAERRNHHRLVSDE